MLDPILLELEGGRYVGPLLPLPLAELVNGKHVGGSATAESLAPVVATAAASTGNAEKERDVAEAAAVEAVEM